MTPSTPSRLNLLSLQKRTASSFLKPLLVALSCFYGLIIRFWSWVTAIKKPATLPGFVVSIGNLSAGGTGKTPAVIMIAQWALQAGHKTAVLSRGYGGRYRENVLEVSDGGTIKSDPGQAGDEPCLMAEKLRGVPVILSKKRFLAGQWAHEHYGADFFILDDGFQHRELRRDLDLVLLDATEPLQQGHLLPWGMLREPVAHLSRAHAFLITRLDQAKAGDDPQMFLHSAFPEKPVFTCAHVAGYLVLPYRETRFDPAYLNGKRIAAFAGIAKPQAFERSLQQWGADILFFQAFNDHHPFQIAEIDCLVDQAAEYGADLLITTEKDWIRIKPLEKQWKALAYLTVQFRILADENLFFDLIKNKIRETNGG